MNFNFLYQFTKNHGVQRFHFHKAPNSIDEVFLGLTLLRKVVELHIDHPRKSKCNCPHADGKRIICKHIVATYFTVLPKEAERFYAEAMAYQEEEEIRQEEMSDKVIEYVGKIH